MKAAFADFSGILTLAHHPILLAVAGLSAIAFGIYSLIESTKDENKQLEEFNSRIKTLDDNLKTDLATVDVTAKRTRDYIVRLEELNDTGEKTAEQQEEYHATLVKLVETVPALAKIIDLETDSIRGGTQALWKNTEAWEQNARQQAYQKYLADVAEEYTQALIKQRAAELAVEDNFKKRQDLEGQERALVQKRTLLLYEAAEMARQFNAAYEGASASADEFYERTSYGAGALQSFDEALSDVRSSIQSTKEDAENLKAELDDANEVVVEATEKYDDAKAVIDSFGDSEENAIPKTENMTGAVKNTGDAMETSSQKADGMTEAIRETGSAMEIAAEQTAAIKKKTPAITEAIQKWVDKYGALYQAAKDSLEKQFKLWDEAERVTTVSVQKANKGIQSQIDYWHDYNRDLNTIKDSGIAGMDLLYKHISDGSTDSVAMAAGIADAILEGNQPAVEKMVSLYKELQEAQGNTAETMMEMQTDMDKAYRELVASTQKAIGDMKLPDDARDAGRETVLSYARGLYSGETSVEKAARSVANVAAKTLTTKTNRATSTYASMYASGTSYAASGLALVGEEGPELVYLRGGERVLTAEETRTALRGMYDIPSSSVASYSVPTAPSAVGVSPLYNRQMTVIVPVEIDGREIARVTAQVMGEEMMFGGY